MKRIGIAVVILIVIVFGLVAPQATVVAQDTPVQCGNVIEGEFTVPDEAQRFVITLSPGDKLTVNGKAEGKLKIGIVILEPTGVGIAASESGGYASPKNNPNASTGTLSAYGNYTIVLSNQILQGLDGTVGYGVEATTGKYQLRIACRLADGTNLGAGASMPLMVPASKPETVTIPIASLEGASSRLLQCGDIFTTEFTLRDEIHVYSVTMEPGDISFRVNIVPVGDHLLTSLRIFNSSNEKVAESNNGVWQVTKSTFADVEVATSGDTYQVYVANGILSDKVLAAPGRPDYSGGVGIYSILVSCVLKDNKVVAPDPAKVKQASAPPTAEAVSSTSAPVALTVNPTAVPATTTTTTQTVTCPGSPETRLYVGAKGNVTPGQSNNLRDNPAGNVTGKLAPGTEVEILDGPQCGKSDLTFWKIQADDKVGWTAEGQGAYYWLVPIEDGRG